MENISSLFINDYYLPPVEHLTFLLNAGQINLLLVYPSLTNISLDSLTYFQNGLFLNNKKVEKESEFSQLKKELAVINEIDDFELSIPFYKFLLEQFLDHKNTLKKYFYSKVHASQKDGETIENEKKDKLQILQDSYNKNINKINDEIEIKLDNFRSSNKKLKPSSEEYQKQVREILLEKEERINKEDEIFNAEYEKIQNEYDNIEVFSSSNELVKKVKKETKNIYKQEKNKLKNTLKSISDDEIAIKKAYDEFYKNTYLPKKEAIKILDQTLIDLGFNLNFLFKSKPFKRFTTLEKYKLKMAYITLLEKKINVLDLVSKDFTYNEEEVLFNSLNSIKNESSLYLVISKDVDIVKLIDEQSEVFISIEGKTVEYASKKEITSNPLVPIVQKLINKVDILQDDLDITLENKGKLEEILPSHYILCNATQLIAYKRLIRYQKHLERKEKENKKKEILALKNKSENEEETVKKPKSNKKDIKNAIEQTVKDVSLSKKIQKRQQEDKDVKVYLIEKRDKDEKWIIRNESSTRVIKLFNTKQEAVDFGKNLCHSQIAIIKIQSSKGKNKGQYQQINF